MGSSRCIPIYQSKSVTRCHPYTGGGGVGCAVVIVCGELGTTGAVLLQAKIGKSKSATVAADRLMSAHVTEYRRGAQGWIALLSPFDAVGFLPKEGSKDSPKQHPSNPIPRVFGVS
jgi:hypothetical protein